MPTRLLVYREVRNVGCRTPRSDLGHLVDELIHSVALPAAALKGQNDADVLGHAPDCADIVADVGRVVVVVPQYGGELARHCIVGDAEADVDREDGVDEDI